MANFTLNVPAAIFPNGTSVSAYPARGQSPTVPGPLGTAINTQTISAGACTFTGLTDGESYVAFGVVNGAYRRVGFTLPEPVPETPMIGATNLEDNAVDTDAIQGEAVTNAKLAAGAVTTNKLAADLRDGATWPVIDAVSDFGADPTGVTNSASAIQDAINALPAMGGEVYLPAGEYKLTTQLNLGNLEGVVLRGAGGLTWPRDAHEAQEAATRLVWKGTGSTSPFNLDNSSGTVLSDLGIYYDSALFTGSLVPFDDSCTQARAIRCHISSRGGLQTAFAAVSMHNSWVNTVDDCTIGGAQWGVFGDRTGVNWSNAQRVLRSTLFGCSVALIGNIKEQWTIDSNTFELEDPVFGVTPAVIASSHGTDTQVSVFSFTNNWVGDVLAGAGALFRQSQYDYWNCVFSGNFLTTTDGPMFDLQGGGVINIVHNPCLIGSTVGDPMIDLGTSGVIKRAVQIVGNRMSQSTEPIVNKGGVDALEIHSNDSESYALDMRTHIGHERIGWPSPGAVPRPTIAAHAALGTSPTVSVVGSDLAGVVKLTPGAGATAGKQATITLGTALTPYAGGLAGLHVTLTPLEGSLGAGAGAGDEAAAAIGIAECASNNTASWSIRTKNAPAAACAWTYRVMGL